MKKKNLMACREYILEDCSRNGIFHNGKMLGKGNKANLKNGDEIILLSAKNQKQNGKNYNLNNKEIIGFVFALEKETILKEIEESQRKKRIQIDEEYSEEMKCGICIDFLFEPVTVIPCLHNVFFQ